MHNYQRILEFLKNFYFILISLLFFLFLKLFLLSFYELYHGEIAEFYNFFQNEHIIIIIIQILPENFNFNFFLNFFISYNLAKIRFQFRIYMILVTGADISFYLYFLKANKIKFIFMKNNNDTFSINLNKLVI